MYENEMDELATLMKAGLESKLVKDEVILLRSSFSYTYTSPDLIAGRFFQTFRGNRKLFFQVRFFDFLLWVDFFLRQIKFNGVPSKPK